MIYLFDDSSDAYVRNYIDVSEYSDVLSFHPQMSEEGLREISEGLAEASCVMVHSSLRDSDASNGTKVYDALVFDICDLGRDKPLVIFSDGFDEPKFRGENCIRQMKKLRFYENLGHFLDKYRQNGQVDLKEIAYGGQSSRVAALNEGQAVLNKLSFCAADETVKAELVAGTSLKSFVETAQPAIGISYPELVSELRKGEFTVDEFRKRINSIIASISQFGSNTLPWKDESCDSVSGAPIDIIEIPKQIPSSHEEVHDFMMGLFNGRDREAVILDTRTDLAFCLKLAMHIRLSPEFIGLNSLIPIILISELSTESIARTAPYAQLLLTEHVYVASEAGTRTCLANATPMKLESYTTEFLSRVTVEPPTYSENDRHGLANQWGAGVLYRTVTGHRFDGDDCPNLLSAQKELYFKYIMMCTCDDLQSLVFPSKKVDFHEDSLRVSAEGKKILLIDDMADKGWTRSLREFLPGAQIDVLDRQVLDIRDYSTEERNLIYENDYDLYILDLRLGGSREENIYDPSAFSGTKILREIKKCNRGRQVIMFTASNKTWNSRALLSPEIGADGYYVKENPSFKFPETFSRKSIETFAEEVRNCFSREYLKEYWDFKESYSLTTESTPALFEECGRQLDMAFDLADWAMTTDQFRHAFVSAEQVFEIMSKYLVEVVRTDESLAMKMKRQDEMCYEAVRKIYLDPQGTLTFQLAVTEAFNKKDSESISMFEKLAATYLQYLGAKDNGLLYILNQMIQVRNRIMHGVTKKEQAREESRSSVLSREEFMSRYASKAPAFSEGRTGAILLDLADKGLLKEYKSSDGPVMVIAKEIANDKTGIQLVLECLKGFFSIFR